MKFNQIDDALKRRVCFQRFHSKFESEQSVFDYANKRFPRNMNLIKEFEDNDNLKLAYVHLLLKQNDFNPNLMRSKFEMEFFENDSIIKAFLTLFRRSNDKNHKIHKDEVIKYIEQKTDAKKQTIIPKLRDYQVPYNRYKKEKNSTGERKVGFFLHCKKITDPVTDP